MSASHETLTPRKKIARKGQATRSMDYTDTIKIVKQGRQGIAEIKHDTPSPMDRIQGSLHGQPLTRDKYCRLLLHGSPVMTDAEFERRTNIGPVLAAKGDALIGGLGIGLIIQPFLEKCSSVTVIEKERDVIDLVGRCFPEVTVIHADIFDWKPINGTRFDTIYFDIWADICSDDLKEARLLHRQFKRYLRPGGYMESWCRIALKYVH